MCRFYNLDFVFYNEKALISVPYYFVVFVFIGCLCASWRMSNRSSLGGRAPVLLKGG